jgi:hypothetical protein
MTFEDFKVSLTETRVPAGVSPALAALWHDGRGDWNAAHETAQDIEGVEGAWVHAYLHRKEGDAPNAAYWYRRAEQPVCRQSLAEEWEAIVRALLGRPPSA